LGEVLRERYPEAVELGKTNATTGQLIEVFRDYGAQGDTARKAIAFYLQAAKFAGDIPLSPLFQTPKVSSTASGKRRPRRLSGSTEAKGNQDEASQTTGKGASIPDLHPALAGVL